MSVLTKRLPSGRIEYKLKNPFGEYKRITESNYEHLSEFNWPDYGATEEEVHYDATDDNFEEVELDDLEINTSDTAPLVEEGFSTTPNLAETGGFVVGGTATGVPSATTLGTGLGIGLGTIAVGTTIAAINNHQEEQKRKHKDPVVSLPDHRFIGPGNTVDETEPVDLDDSIAKEHDINYEKARTQEDVQEADRQGADEFLSDFIDNKNPHSLAGYIGLKTKEKVESVIGVQYPANLPSVSGMSHSRVVRALGKYPIDKDPRKHDDFPKRSDYSAGQFVNRVRYIWDQWNRARQNRGLPRVDPPSRLGIQTTMRPPMNKKTGQRPSNKSITFKEWQARNSGKAGPLIDAFKAGRHVDHTTIRSLLDHITYEEVSDTERMEIEAILKDIDSGSISIADYDNTDGAGPSNAPQQEAPPTQNIEMVDTRGNKRANEDGQGGRSAPSQPAPSPVEAVAASNTSGTGHNSGSDGGFDSAQGPISFLPTGGYQSKGGMMKFTKVHRMKSWALPYFNLSSSVRQGSNFVSTPLAKIPWEFAFFYLSPEEFNLLPAGSYIDSVHIKVMQTVASTGFPTGTTTANIASTNHPKVLIIGKDLEKKCRGGLDKVLSITSEMVPGTTIESISDVYDDFISKQYGTDQTASTVIVPGAAHKIPFYNRGYWCIYQPNRAQALARGFFTESEPGVIDENRAPGFEYFQNYITELNSNDTTWDYVDSMSYKFENAPIGEQFRQLEIFTDSFDQNTGSQNQYFNAKRSVSNLDVFGDTTITESIRPSNRNTVPIVTYKTAPMERGAYFVRGDKAGKPSRQPTFHIGMRAIDKLDPSMSMSRASTFVQANIEFEIEATMIVNLPAYPNRFIKPKFYNTSIENAVQGVGTYPDHGNFRVVTFGLENETLTAPTLAAVDAADGELNEDNVQYPKNRPRRCTPNISKLVKVKKGKK